MAELRTKYPQGSEKHLIKAVLNREVTYDRVSEMVSAEGWTLTERIQTFSTVTDIPLAIARDAIEDPRSIPEAKTGLLSISTAIRAVR